MRFRRSRLLSEGSHTCWEGTLNASTPQGWGSSCLQSPGWGSGGHEDCLFLNVWSPKLPETKEAAGLLPVFFYIHGGSLVAGSGNIYFQGLKEQGLVIVTINYRLNVPGFLALDALTETDEEKASGNYGLSDQVTALRWVQKNIAQFGGDKTRVTIAGQSSGGTSVWNLLAIPSAIGLFAAAIPMSGASRNNVTLAEASHDNAVFLRLAMCDAAQPAAKIRACIDNLSEDRIRSIYQEMCKLEGTLCACGAYDFHMPVATEYQSGVAIIDGVVVKQNLQLALASRAMGAHSRVPTLAGSMAQEATGTPEHMNDATGQRFHAAMRSWGRALGLTDATIGNATRLYAARPDTDEFRHDWAIAYDSVISDIRVVCGCFANVARLVSSFGAPAAEAPVWQYYSDMSAVKNSSTNEAHHGFDLEQLSIDPSDPKSFKTPADREYNSRAIELFATFARTHAPPPGAGFKKFGDVPGGNAGKIGVVGELPADYNINNLDLK